MAVNTRAYGKYQARRLECQIVCAALRLHYFTGLRHHHRMLSTVKKLERPSRLSATDWEIGALDTIAEQGVGAVAVESLARRLGVTKGSFYWHFATREALLKAALERWERDDEQNVLGPVEPISDPRERLRELFRRTSREIKSHVIYSALMGALEHAQVAPLMARVAQRRMDFLTVAYRQVGLERRQAIHRARLAYSAYVGFLQLSLQLIVPRLDHAQYESYVEHTIAALIPD
jgi:AcrR family transcriptional regulator